MMLGQIHPLTLIAENSFSSTCDADTDGLSDNEKLTREEVVV